MRFTFSDLVAVMARLRGPSGCPWDLEQTHASLAPYLLEEAHEVLEAIARGDQTGLREELGDLLPQVVFHSQMAGESGHFTSADVVDSLTRKLIDRHPHVFADVRLGTPDQVLAQWHAIKRRETPERGAFDGIPASLPALSRAQKLIGRAATNGLGGAILSEPERAAGTVAERLDAMLATAKRGDDLSRRQDALGALLLAVVALAAATGIDAESALRGTCQDFVAHHQPAGPGGGPTRSRSGATAGSRRRRSRRSA